jgi:hypothetical protein
MNEVEQLARFVALRSWDDLSEPARAELKIRLLDALGCARGALEAAPVRAIRSLVDDFGGRPLCTGQAGEVCPEAAPAASVEAAILTASVEAAILNRVPAAIRQARLQPVQEQRGDPQAAAAVAHGAYEQRRAGECREDEQTAR